MRSTHRLGARCDRSLGIQESWILGRGGDGRPPFLPSPEPHLSSGLTQFSRGKPDFVSMEVWSWWWWANWARTGCRSLQSMPRSVWVLAELATGRHTWSEVLGTSTSVNAKHFSLVLWRFFFFLFIYLLIFRETEDMRETLICCSTHLCIHHLILLKIRYVLIFWERKRKERKETSVCCSTYWCIHCLIPVRVLIGDWTHNLVVLRQCCDQLSYPTRA